MTCVADRGPKVAQRVQGRWLEPKVPLPQSPPAPCVETQELVPEPHPGQPPGTADGLADLERLSQFSRSLPAQAPFMQPVTLTACPCWAWRRGAPRCEDSRLRGQTGTPSSGLGRGQQPWWGEGPSGRRWSRWEQLHPVGGPWGACAAAPRPWTPEEGERSHLGAGRAAVALGGDLEARSACAGSATCQPG